MPFIFFFNLQDSMYQNSLNFVSFVAGTGLISRESNCRKTNAQKHRMKKTPLSTCRAKKLSMKAQGEPEQPFLKTSTEHKASQRWYIIKKGPNNKYRVRHVSTEQIHPVASSIMCANVREAYGSIQYSATFNLRASVQMCKNKNYPG